MTNTTKIATLAGDGEFTAYRATPAGTPKAAIVVIQEIFGVNAGIRRKCDTLAEAGYLAIAPDLFWRLEPGIELDPASQPERLAFMTAARTDVDASVGYYGVGIDGLLGEKHAIAHPVLLHVPEEDHFVDKAAQAAMHAGLDDHPKVTIYDYAGEDHGFATEFGERRSDASAKLADERTAKFFAENLG
jgi:carboxymethylenebutenolidase